MTKCKVWPLSSLSGFSACWLSVFFWLLLLSWTAPSWGVGSSFAFYSFFLVDPSPSSHWTLLSHPRCCHSLLSLPLPHPCPVFSPTFRTPLWLSGMFWMSLHSVHDLLSLTLCFDRSPFMIYSSRSLIGENNILILLFCSLALCRSMGRPKDASILQLWLAVH